MGFSNAPAASTTASALADWNIVLICGNSVAAGAYALPPKNTAATGWGNAMCANGVLMYDPADNPTTPTSRAANKFPLVDLRATVLASDQRHGETPAVGLVDALKAHVTSAYASGVFTTAQSPVFVAVNTGHSSQLLTDISSENYRAGGEWATTKDNITRIKALADAAGKTCAVVACLLIVGENEGSLSVYAGQAALTAANFITTFSGKIKSFAADLQSQMVPLTGQRSSIPLFCTANPLNMTVSTATHVAADSASDIVCVGSYYDVPPATNVNYTTDGGTTYQFATFPHLSADGSQMVGERVARFIASALRGTNEQGLRPIAIVNVDTTHHDIYFNNGPNDPITIDTATLQFMYQWGLEVYGGTLAAPSGRKSVTGVRVMGPNCIRITCGYAGNLAAVGDWVQFGQAFCAVPAAPGANYTCTVASVAAASAAPVTGHARTNITLTTDITTDLSALIADNAFYIRTTAGTKTGIVRAVSAPGSATTLTIENADAFGTFAAADTIVFGRSNGGVLACNIRTQSSAKMLGTYANDGTNPAARVGKRYPGHRWMPPLHTGYLPLLAV